MNAVTELNTQDASELNAVPEYVDVLIVGAGLSGIGAACHLKRRCPQRSFALLESRADLGGTWDLFRYPGIRSDSDMFTLGYDFKPWNNPKSLADGPAILNYIRETAQENDISRHIHFQQRVVRPASLRSSECLTHQAHLIDTWHRNQWLVSILMIQSEFIDPSQRFIHLRPV